jgi:hypothetical protein
MYHFLVAPLDLAQQAMRQQKRRGEEVTGVTRKMHIRISVA